MRFSTLFLKSTIIFLALAVFTVCFWLPVLAERAAELNPTYAYLKYPVLLGLYVTTIPYFYALHQTFQLLDFIRDGKAFSSCPIASLEKIKRCAIGILVIYVLGMTCLALLQALHPGVAIIGIGIIFITIVIVLLATLFQQLLQNALEIKLEIDLTV